MRKKAVKASVVRSPPSSNLDHPLADFCRQDEDFAVAHAAGAGYPDVGPTGRLI
jgi:hypothetical protein